MAVSIYVLIDPRNDQVRYVGKTVHSLDWRLKGHLQAAKRNKPANSSQWIRELASQHLTPRIYLIDEVPEDMWASAEREWILFYRNLGVTLTNHRSGGSGDNRRYQYTAEHRAKIAASMTGKKHSDETRRKMSQTRKGRKMTDQHREAIRIAQLKRLHCG